MLDTRGPTGVHIAIFALLLAFQGLLVGSAAAAQSMGPADPGNLSQRLREGYALTVSRELARELSLSPGPATPERLLLAAEAHAAAGLWRAVDRLLAGRPWLDSLTGGAGRLLLAKAAQEQGRHEQAIEHFERLDEVPSASGTARSAEVDVLWARSLAAEFRHCEAAERLDVAAVRAPRLAHWFRLSAMYELSEAGDVDAVLVRANRMGSDTAVPRDSVWLIAATAAFRTGDRVRGMRLVDSLSARARARIAGEWIAPTHLAGADTAAAKAVLDEAMRVGGGGAAVGEVILELDDSWSSRRRVAKSDLAAGRYRRAAEQLTEALRFAPEALRPAMVLELARARFGQRDYSQVRRILAPWLEPAGRTGERPAVDAATRASMWFLTGRSMYRRGERTDALDAFARTAEIPGASDGAYASFLIADTWHDRGRLDQAEPAYEQTIARFPRSGYAGTALIRLGLIKLVQAEPAAARERFDRYRRRFPGGNWFQAATFWSATSAEAAGEVAAARVLYREVIGSDPTTYYAMRSGERLGKDTWPDIVTRADLEVPDLSSEHRELIESMNALRSMDWTGRAKREYRRRRQEVRGQGQLLALATELNAAGWTWEGSAIGWSLHRNHGGQWSETLLRIIFPFNFAGPLVDAAVREGLDPALVAAVARRESIFDPAVVSSARAVGLMQVLPSTGAEVARRIGLNEFDASQLTVPEVNLALGSRYLQELLARFQGQPIAALVSYNAGPHRYVRWREFPEFKAGQDIAIDRIPFSETRRYVKAVLSYRHIYRRLYASELSSGAGQTGR